MIGALLAKKAIGDAFESLNRQDLPKFMAAWSDNGTFIYPGEITPSGKFEGKAAVEKWFQAFFWQFPKIQFDIKDICVRNIFAITGNNTVTVHWDVHLVNRDGREGQNSGVTVIYVKNSRVDRVIDYIFDLGENFKRNWSAL